MRNKKNIITVIWIKNAYCYVYINNVIDKELLKLINIWNIRFKKAIVKS